MMGVEGVLGMEALDGDGDGGGSGELPGEPLEGNGKVDCSFVLTNGSEGKLDGTFFVSTVSPSAFIDAGRLVSSEESLSSWLKWKIARVPMGDLCRGTFEIGAKAPGPRSSVKFAALAERERLCLRSFRGGISGSW